MSSMSSAGLSGGPRSCGGKWSTEAESSWPAGPPSPGHGVSVRAGCLVACRALLNRPQVCAGSLGIPHRLPSPVPGNTTRLCLRSGLALGSCELSRPCPGCLCLACSCPDCWLLMCVLCRCSGRGLLSTSQLRVGPVTVTGDHRSPVLRGGTPAETQSGLLLRAPTPGGSSGFSETLCRAPWEQDGPAVRVLGGRRRPLALWPYEESELSPEIALRGEVSSLSGSAGLHAARGLHSPRSQED